MVKILIVDDDSHIRELQALFLKNEGFEIFEASNGVEALEIIETQVINLVILDIMMPEMDGWTLCQEIRRFDQEISLLMVTAKAEAPQKIKGFQLGTDDYLTKPFDPFELVMRVKALLKRAKINASQQLQIGELILDQQSYQVTKGSETIKVTVKEFELLFCLARNPGQIFTREQLINLIWGMDYEGDDRTVDVHIKRIREKFAADKTSFHIESVRSLGYKLVLGS